MALITFRLDGDILQAHAGQKLFGGMMKGRKVKEYSVEELKNMTWEEINTAIKNDLYVDAYEEQKKNPIEYKGKNSLKILKQPCIYVRNAAELLH